MLTSKPDPKARIIRTADDERLALEDIMFKRYGGMLRAVHGLVTRAVNRGDLPLDNVSVRHFLLEARARAVVVDAQTQFAISAMIADGVRRGLSKWEIANGTADGTYKGIEGLFKVTWKNRGLTVARTELGHAQLRASVDRFQAVGVKEVIAHDGDFDPGCQARNGKRYPIHNPPSLLHPNCILTVSPAPVVDL